MQNTWEWRNAASICVASSLILMEQYGSQQKFHLKRMDYLRIYILFHSILLQSGRCADDDERLCALEPRLQFKMSPPPAGLDPGQRLTY